MSMDKLSVLRLHPRLGHFLAQAREELGVKFEPKYENLNYKPESLISIFKKDLIQMEMVY